MMQDQEDCAQASAQQPAAGLHPPGYDLVQSTTAMGWDLPAQNRLDQRPLAQAAQAQQISARHDSSAPNLPAQIQNPPSRRLTAPDIHVSLAAAPSLAQPEHNLSNHPFTPRQQHSWNRTQQSHGENRGNTRPSDSDVSTSFVSRAPLNQTFIEYLAQLERERPLDSPAVDFTRYKTIDSHRLRQILLEVEANLASTRQKLGEVTDGQEQDRLRMRLNGYNEMVTVLKRDIARLASSSIRNGDWGF